MNQQISSFAASKKHMESECCGYQSRLEAATSSQQALLDDMGSIKVQLNKAKLQNLELSDQLKAAHQPCSTAAGQAVALQSKQADVRAQAATASAESHEDMNLPEQLSLSHSLCCDGALQLGDSASASLMQPLLQQSNSVSPEMQTMQQQQQQQGGGLTLRLNTEQGGSDTCSIQQQLAAARLLAPELQSSNTQFHPQLSVLHADNAQLQNALTQLQQQLLQDELQTLSH